MSTAYAGRSSTIQHTYIPATEKQSPTTVSGAQHVQDRTRAVQQVYEAHIDSIYKFIYFKLGNREDAEDITSQVFIKAAHSLDVTQDERTQLAWLYQVARTTITDYWRHYYKAPTSSLEAMEEANPLHLTAEPVTLGGDTGSEISPAARNVQAILDLLPNNYRQVLYFRFLKGYSLKETAAALQTTEANVKVLQHRAIQKALKVTEQSNLVLSFN